MSNEFDKYRLQKTPLPSWLNPPSPSSWQGITAALKEEREALRTLQVERGHHLQEIERLRIENAKLRDHANIGLKLNRIEEMVRQMATKPTQAKIIKPKTPTGRTKLEPTRKRRSVSATIGAEKKATRKAKAWTKAAKGRATVTRKAARGR